MSIISAYADMVSKRKDQYVDSILDLIDEDLEVSDESLQQLNQYLKEYVILDLTYRKLLDIVIDS